MLRKKINIRKFFVHDNDLLFLYQHKLLKIISVTVHGN